MSIAQSRAVDKDDVPTALAIGVIAYACAVLLHEGIGHGTLCALFGGRHFIVTTAELACPLYGDSGPVPWTVRAIAAGGPLVNLIVGTALLFLLPRVQRAPVPWRLFLWFTQGYNLVMGTGYFMFSGLGGLGDWSIVFAGVEPQWLVRTLMLAVGVLATVLAFRYSAVVLVHNVLGTCSVGRLLSVCVPPYLAAGAAAALAAWMAPDGMTLVLGSALPSSLGSGSVFLAMVWMVPIVIRKRGAPPAVRLPRSLVWIVAGAAVLLVFVFVFGPGLHT